MLADNFPTLSGNVFDESSENDVFKGIKKDQWHKTG